MWNDEAESFNDHNHSVMLIKAGKINEFLGGKSIITTQSTLIQKNPDLQETYTLQEWFKNGGGRNVKNRISLPKHEMMSFKEAEIKSLSQSDKSKYYQIKGTIQSIALKNLYYVCARKNCKEMLVDMGDGQYYCTACDVESPNFHYHMKLIVRV